ncbi:hypothetical protein FZ934_11060 [Rhizobium grahamii]|uniref:Uncharacterized protein n=1 Tax=Rhizobium grahamii TaxID=1120045 RepID=A0A5Q0CAK4_9HYPH|nr:MULTISPECIES: hypothetical protein [Rhizobium]QFY60907.1 hypothetical protein FZ934_11060 [Rhizobium grahamii]QRM49944.1 hypothetical protein F3Y33_11830 [Rhizobium sp. BG6]
MTTLPCQVYLFRSAGFAPSAGTVVSVAQLDRVVAVYGAGGVFGEGGLSSAFDGAAVFKNYASGACFIGVWGARNASRFRSKLRAHMEIAVYNEAPDARLSFWGAAKERPKKPAHK